MPSVFRFDEGLTNYL